MRSCSGNQHTSNEISRFCLSQIKHVHADICGCMGYLCINKPADSMPMACIVLLMSFMVCWQLLLPRMRHMASECIGISEVCSW